ncbi:Cytochrome c oxidase subunit 3, partial [Caligus rogercresseyi]
HHRVVLGDHNSSCQRLLITIILGEYFNCLQGLEYFEASFSIRDRVYGSTFSY